MLICCPRPVRRRLKHWNNCRIWKTTFASAMKSWRKLLSGRKALDDELERLRIEVAEAKKQNAARPDDHNYSEAETRDYFVDLLLKEAGWSLADAQDREFPSRRHARTIRGKALSITSCGATTASQWGSWRPNARSEILRVGQQQAKLYADCLEKQFGQRPVIFYSTAMITGSGTM